MLGAGPTGMALACGLRLHGVSVRVIVAAASYSPASKGAKFDA